jgi:hypothetical protein
MGAQTTCALRDFLRGRAGSDAFDIRSDQRKPDVWKNRARSLNNELVTVRAINQGSRRFHQRDEHDRGS